MKTIQTIKQIRDQVKDWKKSGLSVGFVPTMGFLHEGHESLIKAAARDNDRVVVSIFVNPTQFGPNEDLTAYPRDIDSDMILCEKAGADIIFNPEVSEMYSSKSSTTVNVDGLTKGLCGKSRPTHFGGVCTVVLKLFNIIPASKAYFGEKDAQQLAVIKRMVKDLDIDIEIIGCPIIRESDGLAKSSRNTYLNKEERSSALILSKSLNSAKKLIESGERDVKIILNSITDTLNSEPLAKIDYVELVSLETFFSFDTLIEKGTPILIAIAVFVGKTRLIDNFHLEV